MVVTINKELYGRVFSINDEIMLNANEKQYLLELEEEFIDLLEEYGLGSDYQIKEIVLDALTDDRQDNIIDYLGIKQDEVLKDSMDAKLADEGFTKVENKEDDKEFFKDYLTDNMLNDLYYSWAGYVKKNEGTKEIFNKTRKAIIPTEDIDTLYQLLVQNFNKINFVSKKEDTEQAEIITLTLEQASSILENIEYECCDTKRSEAILSNIAIKMLNLVGYSDGHRQEFLSALSDSFQSKDTRSNRKATNLED